MDHFKGQEDIENWANETLTAAGDKFTALSKNDQFMLAKYIVDSVNRFHPLHLGEGGIVRTNVEGKEKIVDVPPASEPKDDKVELKPMPMSKRIDPPTTVKIMRRKKFADEGKDAQAAYDEFLQWAAENQRDAFVMDFSNGKSEPAAAFAYWLTEPVEMKV